VEIAMARSFALFPLLFVVPTFASAATLRVPSEYPTIQQALDVAAEGDLVLVAPGTHAGSLRAAAPRGTMRGDAPRESVVVSGDASAPVVTIPPQTSLLLESLTLRGGYSDHSGGGVRAQFGGEVAIVDCVVTGNGSAQEGGGVGITEGIAGSIRGSLIADNQAGERGGGIHVHSARFLIDETTIEGNTAPSGAGIYALGSELLLLRESRVTDNAASDHGGGMSLYRQGSVRIETCTFEGNRAQRNGGAISASDAGEVVISSSLFRDNFAALGGDHGSGGGAAFFGATAAEIVSTSFEGNHARSGGALRGGDDATVDVTDCVFRFNEAGNDTLEGFGGGINFWNGAFGQVADCVFEQNSSRTEGGALHVHDADAVMTDLVVCENTCVGRTGAEGWGGGIFIFNTFSEISDSHICRNETTRSGGGIYSQGFFYQDRPRPTGSLIARNLIEENRAEAGGGIESAYFDSLWIEGNVIRENQADRKGGLAIDQRCAAHVRNNRIEDNVATSTITTLGGAGIFTSGSVVDISGNTIAGNAAPGGHGGGLRVTGRYARVLIRDNVIAGNNSQRGGGFFFDTAAQFVMRHNLLHGNRASEEGGGIILNSPCAGRIESNTIVASIPEGDRAAAVAYMGECAVSFERNIVAGTRGGYGIRTTAAQQSTPLSHNLFWNNEAGPTRGPASFEFEIQADPHFVPADSSYRPAPQSLAIDTGGRDPAGDPRDLGWVEHDYPAQPRVQVRIEEAPELIRPGEPAQARLRVDNLSVAAQEVLLTFQAAGRHSPQLAEPRSLTLPAGASLAIDGEVQVPDPCPDCAGGTVLVVRAWIDDQLESGDASEMWIEAGRM